jgi:hypothetical protein
MDLQRLFWLESLSFINLSSEPCVRTDMPFRFLRDALSYEVASTTARAFMQTRLDRGVGPEQAAETNTAEAAATPVAAREGLSSLRHKKNIVALRRELLNLPRAYRPDWNGSPT